MPTQLRIAEAARVIIQRDSPNDWETMVVVQQYLGEAYNGRGHYDKALEAYRQGYDLLRQRGGEPAKLAVFMSAFGNVLFQMGRIDEGENWIRQAMQTYQRADGENSSGVADCLYRLGALYTGTGRFAEAEAMLRKSLEIARKVEDVEEVKLCYIYDTLANAYIHQHRLDEAEALVRKSMEIRRRDLPSDHIAHVDNAWAMGMIAADRGRYDEAEKQLKYTLDTYEAKLGEDHYLTANVRFYYANVQGDLGRWDQAVTLYEQVLASAKRITGGEEHPEAVWVYNALAKAYLNLGELEKAKAQADKAVQIGAVGQRSHPTLRQPRSAVANRLATGQAFGRRRRPEAGPDVRRAAARRSLRRRSSAGQVFCLVCRCL